MRLEAPNARGKVWDCEATAEIRPVLWVDDELNQYGLIAGADRAAGCMIVTPVQVRKVWIVRAENPVVVLINPVADDESMPAECVEAIAA